MEASSQPEMASSCNIGGLEGIAELLRCYICMEGLKDTTLCPHCCKLVCFNCVTRWISENRADCPHCRVALTVRDLVKMPLFDDLVTVVEELRSKQEDVSRLPSNEAQICPTHSHQLSVFCDTCHAAICYECALFSGQHKEHSFQPIDQLHKKHKRALETELHKLKDRMRDILSFVLQVEKRVEVIKVSKSKTKREIQHVVEKMYSRVDNRSKDKLTKLADCRHFLRSQALKVMKTAHDLEKKLATGSYWSLVNKEGELKKEVRESLDKLYSLPLKMDALSAHFELPNELVPGYVSGVFKIQPFKELQRRGEEIYSESLKVDGLTWRLKVYPNGHHEDVGRYLAVFMELSEGYDKITSYQYCIEMMYNCSDKYPQRNYSRDYVSDFGDGECWGYKKYYQLSKLATDGFLKNDTVFLRFSVRHMTYHDQCKDLKLYVSRMSEDKEVLKEQLKESQQQLNALRAENKKLGSSVRPRSSPGHSRAEPKPTRRISPRSRQQLSGFPHHTHTHSNPHESPTICRYPIPTSTHHNSPKRSAYSKYEEPSPRHLLVGRRRSHDMSPRKILEHRRRSADPAVNFESEGESSRLRGRPYYSQGLFEDSNSDHGGSQSLVNEEPSYNTAGEGETTTLTAGTFKQQPDLSQVEFNDEDHAVPSLVVEPELGYLSQPPSPSKMRVGKSLTDIHSLSQSYAGMGYQTQWDSGPYYAPPEAGIPEPRWFHDGRFLRPVAKPTLSAPQGQIRRMRSDPHLGYEPTTVKSSSLKKVDEEEEQRVGRGRRSKVKGHHLDKKHLQATVVVETAVPKSPHQSPKANLASGGSKSGGLASGGKSNSTSSLNLSQIL